MFFSIVNSEMYSETSGSLFELRIGSQVVDSRACDPIPGLPEKYSLELTDGGRNVHFGDLFLDFVELFSEFAPGFEELATESLVVRRCR